MSIGNPLLAKLALDNAAKHTSNMRALWTYETIADTVWQIPDLTDFGALAGEPPNAYDISVSTLSTS